jgi:RNA-binding protein 39
MRQYGSPRGTAYVQFTELRDAQTALDAMNGFEIAGRTSESSVLGSYAVPRRG